MAAVFMADSLRDCFQRTIGRYFEDYFAIEWEKCRFQYTLQIFIALQLFESLSFNTLDPDAHCCAILSPQHRT